MATDIPNQPLIQELTPNDLPHVLVEVSPLSPHNVVNFGLILNVKKEVIEGFEVQYSRSMRDVLREIVNQRLKQEPALTWRDIVSALRSPLVQEEELARKIECQYIPYIPSTHEHKRSDTLDSTNAQLVIPRASPCSSQVSRAASQTNQHPGYYEGLPPPTLPQHSIHQPPYQSQSSNIYAYQQLPPQQSVVQYVSQQFTGQRFVDVSVVCGPTISLSRPPLPSTANPTSALVQTSGEPVPPRPQYNFPLSPAFHQSIPQHPNQSPLHSTVAYHQPPPPNPLYQHPTQYAPHLPTHPPPCQHIPPTYPYYAPPYPPVHYGPPPQVASSVASTHDVPETGAPAAKRPREQSPVRPHPQPHSLPSQQLSTSQSKPDRSPLVSQYIDYVRTIYKSSEVEKDSYSLKWPPTPSKVYINLVCIDRTKVGQRNEYDEVTKVMVEHGDVDVVHGKKWPIDFNEVAAGIPDIGLEQVVLVEGAPGVGKSTFAWEYCRRWERGEIAQQYQLVLLLRLRDERMSKAKTLRDLIYHPSENVSEAVFTDLVSSMGANAIIILEGFDELPDACRNSQSIFMQLISNKLLPSATVMVTSRPWATKKVLKDYKHRMYQHIEILGFTTQQISKYIHSVLSESEAKDLESYVKNHPQIKGCMYIPLNSAIVVTVYQESQSSGCPMPKTLTELYTALAKTLLVRYQNGHSEIEKSNKEHTIGIFNERFPYTIKNNFNKLCKLAYSGIVREGDEVQLIFKESDLPADFDNLGFMDSVTELYVTRGTVSSHNFLHLTFQEFFAAVHISTMSPAEQLQHFQGFKDGRLNVVLRFLAGVSQLSCLSTENVPHALLNPLDHENNSAYGVKCEVIMDSTLVNWIFEAQTDTVFDMLLRNRSVKYYTGWSIEPMDYYALGYCIAHSQSQWFLCVNNLHAENIELLMAGVSLVPNPRSKVVGMDIPVTKRAAKVFDGLKDMLDLHQLSLGLPLEVIDIHWLIHWLDLSSLQVLTLNMRPKNPWQLEALIPLHLKSLTLTLPDEDVIDNVLLPKDCIALENFIVTTATLKEFIIEEFFITEEEMEIITCALATNKSLSMERLEFNSECYFNDTIAEYMTLFVAKASSTLKYLCLSPYEGPVLTEFTEELRFKVLTECLLGCETRHDES